MNTTPPQPAGDRRILIVDDNPAIHEDFKKILGRDAAAQDFDALHASFFGEESGGPGARIFQIDSAAQGREALAMVEQALREGRPYAMAFIDVRMPPGWDGIQTIEKIWEVYPDLQVVLCTAYSDYSWEDMIAKLGQSDRLVVLKKPFDNIEALQLACTLCEKWKLTRQARALLADAERTVGERTRELCDTNAHLHAEIGQRKQAEAHLLRAQRLESIGTLASGIAHDLNNMLSPILMSAELLCDEPPSKIHQALVSTIQSSAQRAAGIVKQVLAFARGVEGERVLLQPRHLLSEIASIISETFPKSIRIKCDLPRELGCLKGDATQLHQVLMNLCVNARDAMPGGGTLRLSAGNVELDAQYASMTPEAHAGSYLTVRISDTGTGIPQEIIEKIFDPFFTTKEIGKGTGLGLSTAIGIVRSHDGFLNVRSELDKGTTFEIFLPLATDGAVSIADKNDSPPPAGHGEFILAVDDETQVRNMTSIILTQHGYHTLIAADGAEAVSIYALRGGDIRVVLTDIMMPVMDGVALCRTLRKMNPEVRLIATTGYADESHTQELRSLNMCAVLSKPFSAATLLATLGEAISSQSASAPRRALECA